MTTTLTTGGRLASSLVHASRGASSSSSSSCSNTTTTTQKLFGVRAVHRSTFHEGFVSLGRRKGGGLSSNASRRNATNFDGTNDVGGGGEEDDGKPRKGRRQYHNDTRRDDKRETVRIEFWREHYTIARKDSGKWTRTTESLSSTKRKWTKCKT